MAEARVSENMLREMTIGGNCFVFVLRMNLM